MRKLGLLGALILTSGCASGGGTVQEVPPVFFPGPPDTARIQYLTRFSSEADIASVKSRSFLDQLAGSNNKDTIQLIVRPFSIAVAPGRLYVCDVDLPGVEILDLQNRTFEVFRPSGQGALGYPIACAVDPPSGRLFVGDVVQEAVLVYDSTGEFTAKITDDSRPTDVLVDRDAVWVAYARGNKVVRYDSRTLEPVLSIPADSENPEHPLGLPTGLAVLEDELYVSDQGRFEVQVYSRSGSYIRTVGELGNSPGSFARPKGVAVSRDSLLYAVDAAFQNVQMFDNEGQLLMWFGGAYAGPGYMYLPAGIAIDYENVQFFADYVAPGLDLKYLVFVANQLGPDKVSVYGFVGP